MECAATLGHPRERGVALDFGCGVGRLTRALAAFFDRATGVDISSSMIEEAKKKEMRSLTNASSSTTPSRTSRYFLMMRLISFIPASSCNIFQDAKS